MLDTAGEFIKIIILLRIDTVIEPILADSQYGFCKRLSTIGAINFVVNTAKEANVLSSRRMFLFPLTGFAL